MLRNTISLNKRPVVPRRLIMLCTALLLWSACISFSVHIPDDPELAVVYCTIVNELRPEHDYPVNSDMLLTTRSTEPVYAVIKVENISHPLSLHWQWYDPQKKCVKTSDSITINAKQKYLAFFIAWDKLSSDYFQKKSGVWSVSIWADKQFLQKKEFTVTENSSGL